MKALIFSGALETKETSTSIHLANYLREQLINREVETDVFKIAGSGIPLFDPVLLKRIPIGVERMNILFREADFHIWLAPLYHGSIPGVMKNCFDWLEISAKEPFPYLSGKRIGLICWADGMQAMQGINAMDAIAKALRAWVAPYTMPIKHQDLFDHSGEITPFQKHHFEILLKLLIEKF